VPSVRLVFVATALALLVGMPQALAAQQRYLLQLAPRPGDTLRMRVDQQTEVKGAGRMNAPARAMKGALTIFSHAVVTGQGGGATTLLAKTDSVMLDSDDEHAQEVGDQVRRFGAGKPVNIRLAGNGTVRLLDDAGNPVRQSETLALIPAALPEGALAVGDTWVRSMPLPIGPATNAGMVHATFRLDSVSRGGRIAFISVQGELEQGAVPAAGPRGTMMRVVGTLVGQLHLDRIRGWIADSRFQVTLNSAVEPPAGSGIAPVRFTTVVTQHMRLDEGRGSGTRRRATPEQAGRP